MLNVFGGRGGDDVPELQAGRDLGAEGGDLGIVARRGERRAQVLGGDRAVADDRGAPGA